MADTCPRCDRYDYRNVHNLVSCAICTLQGAIIVKGASGDEIKAMKERNKTDRKKRVRR